MSDQWKPHRAWFRSIFTGSSIGPWSAVLRFFGHGLIGGLSLLIPLVLFFKYRSVPCQYIFMVDVLRDLFVFIYCIPCAVLVVFTALSAARAESYLCDRPLLVPTLVVMFLLLIILAFYFSVCSLNLSLAVFVNQRISPPACTGHVCPLIELAQEERNQPFFYLVYTQLHDGSWYVTKTIRESK